jgi:hypothetical protein
MVALNRESRAQASMNLLMQEPRSCRQVNRNRVGRAVERSVRRPNDGVLGERES